MQAAPAPSVDAAEPEPEEVEVDEVEVDEVDEADEADSDEVVSEDVAAAEVVSEEVETEGSAEDALTPASPPSVARAAEEGAVASAQERAAADAALREEAALMDAELAQGADGGGDGVIQPPGFDWTGVDDGDLALFTDLDRKLGRGAGQGEFIAEILDVVDLTGGPDLTGDLSSPDLTGDLSAIEDTGDEASVIETGDASDMSEADRSKLVAINFSGPTLDEDDARLKVEICNEALAEIARALDEKNGPSSGQACVQLLIDGTPREFEVLFRGVEADREGQISVETVLRNLRRRPPSEHRALINRGVRDLVERALSSTYDELDDDEADRMLERVLEFERRLGL